MNGDSNDFDVLDRIARALEQVNGFGDHVCVFKNAGLINSAYGPWRLVQACTCGETRQIKL